MGLLRYSPWDAALVALAGLQVGALLLGVSTFGAVSPWTSLGIGLAAVFLICTNYQCVAHNFLHNPFFVSPTLNVLFSGLCTVSNGVPQSLYRLHHLQHHQHGNDAPDPGTGSTGDHSSTWRHSQRRGYEESFLRYALLAFFRTDAGHLVRIARRQGRTWQVLLESALLIGFVLLLVAMNPRGTLLFYLPVWYLGQVAAHAENYLEHYGALPGDRQRDSVSCYSRWYNLIWFNNGFHQEHHFRPKVHWTQIPSVRADLPAEEDRRVVRGAHWFNFGPVRPDWRGDALLHR